MQLPAKQTKAAAQASHQKCAIRIGCPVVLRTDGRTHSDVVTKTQISSIDRLPRFVIHGALRAFRSCAINTCTMGARVRSCATLSWSTAEADFA